MYLLHMLSKLLRILELLITCLIFTLEDVWAIMFIELMFRHKVIILEFTIAIAALYPLVVIII